MVATAAGQVAAAQAFSVLPHVTARSTSSVTVKNPATAAVTDTDSSANGVTGRGSVSQTSTSKTGSSSSVTRPRDSVSSVK
jgi:hypothetical protein